MLTDYRPVASPSLNYWILHNDHNKGQIASDQKWQSVTSRCALLCLDILPILMLGSYYKCKLSHTQVCLCLGWVPGDTSRLKPKNIFFCDKYELFYYFYRN